MKIVFDEHILRKAYDFLNNVQDLDKDEGDEYLQESEVVKSVKNDLNSHGVYGLGPSELPYPLKGISFSVRRQSEFYEAYSVLVSRENESCFNNLSNHLKEKNWIDNSDFIPTCSYGGGYLIENPSSKDIAYVLSHSKQEKNEVIQLVFGNSGSKLRKFEDFNNFLIDIKRIEKITDSLISQIYDLNNINLSKLENIELLVS